MIGYHELNSLTFTYNIYALLDEGGEVGSMKNKNKTWGLGWGGPITYLTERMVDAYIFFI